VSMAPSDLPPVSKPLPWHQQVWNQLNQQLQDGQLPHALLLVGRPYTGKLRLAVSFARLLLCAHSQNSLNCGKCHACELSASGAHGDFHWVTPQEKSRVIKVDQVRGIVSFANTTAGFGQHKVIVIAPADSMNVNAFNALLKSLEEPAKGTYLILVCDHLHGVPATIRSRCRILRLPTPDEEASLQWLESTTGQLDRSRGLLAISDGMPLLARQMHLDGNDEELSKRRISLEALLTGQMAVSQVCALWSEVSTETTLENLTADLQRILGSLTLEQLRTRRGKMLFTLLDEIYGLRKAVRAGANPNKQLMMEALMSKLSRRLGDGQLDDKIPPRAGETGL
jgi:DNA polymerase III subunit delta'